MNPLDIIEKYYAKGSRAYCILVDHSRRVSQKALEVAGRVPHLAPDADFIKAAAMLHDIGIVYTRSPSLGCYGSKAYIWHGVLGRELLEKEGLHRHALVCERHVGAGITLDDIRSQQLPIPQRDMLPVSIEEQIICYADKFFSKSAGGNGSPRSVDEILLELKRYGKDNAQRFSRWVELFSPE